MVVPTVLATIASTRARLSLSVDAGSSLILTYSLFEKGGTREGGGLAESLSPSHNSLCLNVLRLQSTPPRCSEVGGVAKSSLPIGRNMLNDPRLWARLLENMVLE
jgi:hypothetical protein